MPSLPRCLTILVLPLFSLLFSPQPALALENPASHSAQIQATVPEFKVDAPILIAPSNYSLTNNPTEPFEWLQAVSIQGISYHTFYLDGQPIIPKILTSIPTINTPDYFIYHLNGRLYLTLKNPMAEGSHTWQVSATSVGGTTAYSDLWHFTIDSTLPPIILRQVDQNKMYWATHDPNSIPPYEDRHLIVTTPDPLILGQVEAPVSFKYALICPLNALAGCREQSITVSEDDGNFAHRFTDLEPHYTYFVYLIATDLAGNTTYFPVFTITYTPKKPIIPLPPIPGIITPTPTPPPPITPITPEPTPLPPLPPTPTPTPSLPPVAIPDYSRLLHSLIVFGLLLHLSLSILGARIKLSQSLRFITRLLIPITRGQKHFTNPYATLEIYHPDHLNKVLKYIFANPFGAYSLPSNLPEIIFVRFTRPGLNLLTWLNKPDQLPQYLYLEKLDDPPFSDKLRRFLFHSRLIAILIAIITSAYAVMVSSYLYFVIYLLISLLLFTNQYLLPHFLKPNPNAKPLPSSPKTLKNN